MRRSIFVDTSAWYAMTDADDADHVVAQAFIAALDRPLLTSNFVIAETITLVRDRLGHAVAIQVGEQFRKKALAEIVRITEKDENAAWRIFARYRDKEFSFVDCTSFAVMERLKLNTAFAFDAHFEQYGKFIRLPIH